MAHSCQHTLSVYAIGLGDACIVASHPFIASYPGHGGKQGWQSGFCVSDISSTLHLSHISCLRITHQTLNLVNCIDVIEKLEIVILKHDSKSLLLCIIYLFARCMIKKKKIAVCLQGLPTKRKQSVMTVCPDGLRQSEKCFLTQT